MLKLIKVIMFSFKWHITKSIKCLRFEPVNYQRLKPDNFYLCYLLNVPEVEMEMICVHHCLYLQSLSPPTWGERQGGADGECVCVRGEFFCTYSYSAPTTWNIEKSKKRMLLEYQ